MTDPLTPERVRALLDAASPGWEAERALGVIMAGGFQVLAAAPGNREGNLALALAAPDLARALLAAWEERDEAEEDAAAASAHDARVRADTLRSPRPGVENRRCGGGAVSTLYAVQQIDVRGVAVCDVEAWLVLARSPQHAVDLVVADGWRAEESESSEAVAIQATPAEWTRGGEPPLPFVVTRETIQYGIWIPRDATWAGYGFEPEGWAHCSGCGLVRNEETEWVAGGDECDECIGCGLQGCDAAADRIGPDGVGWCAAHRDRGES